METNTVSETIYRTLLIISGIVMFAIRIYYQRKIRSEQLHTEEQAAQGPTPAAIANAVFDAVRIRLREIPFSSKRVRAALKN